MTPAPSAEPPARLGTHLARVAAVMAIGLVIHGYLVWTTGLTARDSIGFAQLALQYESPDPEAFPRGVVDVMTRAKPPHPPGYPIAVMLTSKVVRAVTAGPLPEQMLLSTQVASVVAAALWAIPCYILGTLLFSRFEGFAAALLLQMMPVMARVSSDGLTEAWYLLFYTSGAAAGTAAVKSGRGRHALLAGLFGGLAYLVRPEGLLVAAAGGLAFLALGFQGHHRVRVFRHLALLGLGTGLTVLPYMLTIGRLTLKPTGQALMTPFAPENAALPAAGPLLAVSYDPGADGSRTAWLIKAVLDEGLKTSHYGVGVYALIGLGLAVGQFRRHPAILMTVTLIALNVAVVIALGHRKDYLSERHALPCVVLGTFYAAFALRELPRLFTRYAPLQFFDSAVWKWVGLAALAASCLAVAFKPLHLGRVGHRMIGHYLKDHATDADVIIDPYTWAEYYSGRSLKQVPPDPPNPRYRFAILEEGESHSTLTRLEAALNVANDQDNPAELVRTWDDPTKGGRRISLYRQTARP